MKSYLQKKIRVKNLESNLNTKLVDKANTDMKGKQNIQDTEANLIEEAPLQKEYLSLEKQPASDSQLNKLKLSKILKRKKK